MQNVRSDFSFLVFSPLLLLSFRYFLSVFNPWLSDTRYGLPVHTQSQPTVGQTDGRTTEKQIFHLCVSRGAYFLSLCYIQVVV